MKRAWRWFFEGSSVYVPMKWVKFALFLIGLAVMLATWSMLLPVWLAPCAAVLMIGVILSAGER